jgi:hypothetical protein
MAMKLTKNERQTVGVLIAIAALVLIVQDSKNRGK